jgi:hypothetical protein
MSIATTIDDIRPCERVVINIGFDQVLKRGRRYVSFPEMCRILVIGLSETLEKGFEAVLARTDEDNKETVLIARGVFKQEAASSDVFWRMLKDTNQDCAALQYPDTGEGVLYGPDAGSWGKFDSAKFLDFPTNEELS